MSEIKRIRIEQECSSCQGTGIYKGMGERDSFGVQCHSCKGSGKEIFSHEYKDFEGRKERKDISWVLQTNPGICVGGVKEGKFPEGYFGGITYEEWLSGKKFPRGSEMRNLTCPAWWYQSADYKKKPDWKECICCGSFSDCSRFKEKSKCWEKFDCLNG